MKPSGKVGNAETISSVNSAVLKACRRGAGGLVVALGVMAAGLASAEGAAVFNVSFDDPGAQFERYYAPLRSSISAAGSAWSRYLGGGGSVDISVRFADLPTMTGVSATSVYVGSAAGTLVFEQGVLGKLRNGVDPNGAAPDAIITIGRTYLTNELWFDPNPFSRTAPVPTGRTDAESALLHEFGHILAFSGWRDPTSGALPGNYESSYDGLVTRWRSALYFGGADADRLYGGLVPLTLGSYQHVGNAAPGRGADLLGDLMNGVQFYRGTRYWISPLDIAMLEDVEGQPLTDLAASVPTTAAAAPDPAGVPEPSSVLLLGSGILLLGALGRFPRRAPGA